MSAARDVVTARARLAECRAIIGGEFDPFLIVWDEQATDKDRRTMLTLAGESNHARAFYAGYAWIDLPAELRGRIIGAMRKFSAWAERLQ